MFNRATKRHSSRENKWIHFILSEFKTQTQRKLKKTNGMEKALAITCVLKAYVHHTERTLRAGETAPWIRELAAQP